MMQSITTWLWEYLWFTALACFIGGLWCLRLAFHWWQQWYWDSPENPERPLDELELSIGSPLDEDLDAETESAATPAP